MARGSLEIPFATTKMGVAHSIPNITASGALTLDANTLSAIYGCTITVWNDPMIAALNPNVTCALSGACPSAPSCMLTPCPLLHLGLA
jgi:ABC-type phosphate transport system substrate-binding protein